MSQVCTSEYFIISISTVVMCDASGTVRPLHIQNNYRGCGFWKGHVAHIMRKKDSTVEEQIGGRLTRWMHRLT